MIAIGRMNYHDLSISSINLNSYNPPCPSCLHRVESCYHGYHYCITLELIRMSSLSTRGHT